MSISTTSEQQGDQQEDNRAPAISLLDILATVVIAGIALSGTIVSFTQIGIPIELSGAVGGVIFAALMMAYVVLRKLRGLGNRTGKLEHRTADVESRVTKLEHATGAINVDARQPAGSHASPPAQQDDVRKSFGKRPARDLSQPAQDLHPPQRTAAHGAMDVPGAQSPAVGQNPAVGKEELIDRFARELVSNDTSSTTADTAPASAPVPTSPTMEAIQAVAKLQASSAPSDAKAAPDEADAGKRPADTAAAPSEMQPPIVSKTLMAEALTNGSSGSAPNEDAGNQTAEPSQPAPLGSDVLKAIQNTIKTKSLELYLQPILAINDRRVEFYEVLTRIELDDGRHLSAVDFTRVATEHGLISRLDHLMLLKSIQVARRLKERESHRTLFCNLSTSSLTDPGFFSAFLRYLQDNTTLTESLIFQFSQDQFANCTDVHWTGLQALSDIGYRFSLDGITDLGLDLDELRTRNFQFLKVPARTLIDALGAEAAPEAAKHLHDSLSGIGIRLIVEQIDDEAALRALARSGMNLGQGSLFAEPRPVRPDVFEEQQASQQVA